VILCCICAGLKLLAKESGLLSKIGGCRSLEQVFCFVFTIDDIVSTTSSLVQRFKQNKPNTNNNY